MTYTILMFNMENSSHFVRAGVLAQGNPDLRGTLQISCLTITRNPTTCRALEILIYVYFRN